MGLDFKNYMIYSLYCCLKPSQKGGDKNSEDRRLNLVTEDWPEQPLDEELPNAEWVVGAITIDAIRMMAGQIKPGSDLTVKDSYDAANTIKDYFEETPGTKATARVKHKFATTLNLYQDFYEEGSPEEKKKVYLSQENELKLKSKKEKIVNPIQEALSIWGDWVMTLDFLSRIENSYQGGVHLGKRKSSVIDSFNRNITFNRRPNLCHIMLTHLARPLRVDTILTTNFDTLTEQAFDHAGRPLETFDVSINGTLPDLNQTLRRETIIKLHGTNHGTRADFSLNDRPNPEEMEKFTSYFQIPLSKEMICSPKHLLVIGYSASDDRIVKFILDAIKKFGDNGFKVFWIYFSDSDHTILKNNFPNLVTTPEETFNLLRKKTKKNIKANPIIACRSHYPDLFLHEIYQGLSVTMMSGGLPYPYLFKTPPNPFFLRNQESKYVHIARSIEKCILDGKNEIPKSITEISINKIKIGENSDDEKHIYTIDGINGVSSVSSILFERMVSNFKKCIWIDLTHFKDFRSLLTYIYSTISQNNGSYFLDHVSFDPDNLEKHGENILKNHLRTSPNKWYIFLNGRERPGAGLGWESSEFIKKDTPPNYDSLWKMMDIISHQGFNIVYLPYSRLRLSNLKKTNRLRLSNLKNTNDYESFLDKKYDELNISNNKNNQKLYQENASIEQSLIEWWDLKKETYFSPLQISNTNQYSPNKCKVTEKGHKVKDQICDWNKIRFVYALTLFRNPRHYVALFSPAVFYCIYSYNRKNQDNDIIRSEVVKSWLQELREIPLFVTMPGGFLWMHADVRLRIQTWLENLSFKLLETETAKNSKNKVNRLLQRKSWIHQAIADWYDSAFRATQHGMPLIESIYHRGQAIKFADEQTLWSDRINGLNMILDVLSDKKFKKYDARKSIRDQTEAFQIREILKASEILEVASPAVRLWLHPGISSEQFSWKASMIDPIISKTAIQKYQEVAGFCHFLFACGLNNISYPSDMKTDNEVLIKSLDILFIQFKRTASTVSEKNGLNRQIYTGALSSRKATFHLPPEYIQNDISGIINSGITERSLKKTEVDILFNLKKLLIEGHSKNKLTREKAIEKLFLKVERQTPTEKDKVKFKNDEGKYYSALIDAIGNTFFYDLESNLFSYEICEYCEDKVLEVIKLLNIFMFNQIQIGKDEFFRSSRFPDLSKNHDARMIRICACAKMIKRFSRWISPAYTNELYEELIDTYCFYSIALARLNRFAEAQRTLDEAAAYAHSTYTENRLVNLAKIELRRAEILIRQEIKIDEESSKSTSTIKKEFRKQNLWRSDGILTPNNDYEREIRLRSALLDQAWGHLDWAHQYLKETSRSVHLWGRLYFLRTRCVSELSKLQYKLSDYLKLEKIEQVKVASKITSGNKNIEENFKQRISEALMLQPKDGIRAMRILSFNVKNTNKTSNQSSFIIEDEKDSCLTHLTQAIHEWLEKRNKDYSSYTKEEIINTTYYGILEYLSDKPAVDYTINSTDLTQKKSMIT